MMRPRTSSGGRIDMMRPRTSSFGQDYRIRTSSIGRKEGGPNVHRTSSMSRHGHHNEPHRPRTSTICQDSFRPRTSSFGTPTSENATEVVQLWESACTLQETTNIMAGEFSQCTTTFIKKFFTGIVKAKWDYFTHFTRVA